MSNNLEKEKNKVFNVAKKEKVVTCCQPAENHPGKEGNKKNKGTGRWK